MARLTWASNTAVDVTNLAKLTQDEDLKPTASTYNGPTGRVITHNYGHQNYIVIVMPTATPGGNLGEVYYTKANNTVTIYNSGSFRGAFDYVILPHA
jgi:hypothetical protein